MVPFALIPAIAATAVVAAECGRKGSVLWMVVVGLCDVFEKAREIAGAFVAVRKWALVLSFAIRAAVECRLAPVVGDEVERSMWRRCGGGVIVVDCT